MFDDERTRPIAVPGARRRLRLPVTILIAFLLVTGILGYVIFQANAAGRPTRDERTATVVFDRSAGKQVVGDHGGERFRTASVVKLFIALDALTHDPRKSDQAQINRMLSKSDDAIANTLWTRNGASAIVTRTVAAIGLKNTSPPADAGRWGDTLSTADDIVATYRHILALPKAKRNLILKPLREAPRTAADGFDQHFGIPTAFEDRPWAVKQGWAAGRGAVDAHTTGLVGEGDRYIVVILSSHADGTALAVATASATSAAASLVPRLEK
ncbi:serine hydrolase [Amycolatopsis sp. NPDC089917]|uniref:serine hydrolase n=1 Tax=Amycolatopsis sp. NPDC089917 TaxID=3155187 RepID=UPI003423AD02